MQLNKLQIKAEILLVISKLQTNFDAQKAEEIVMTLVEQEDKKSILEILAKELLKSNEERVILVCFLMLKLSEKADVENILWEALVNPSLSDSVKAILLNVLKDMGNKVDYEKLGQFFENPNEVIDSDTQKLLNSAIINPEAQIDFLDFVNSLSEFDKKLLIQSLGDDYSSDNLANILNPLVLYQPDTELGLIAIDILGTTKSQLALHTLLDVLNFSDDEAVVSAVKKNVSQLKIAGVREDNSIEFYKSVLTSKPFESYTSYPDGHGNQALIFSREREDETLQLVAVVINDTRGIVDCFGFNEISKTEFERIVNKFYNGEDRVYINPHVAKTLLINAEKLTRKIGAKISYEYICWKVLFADIEIEQVPIELTLKSALEIVGLSSDDMNKIYDLSFVQKWFFDAEYDDEFKNVISNLNDKLLKNDFDLNLGNVVAESLAKIFTSQQKNILDKRILSSSYLKYLSGESKDAQLLYSLYFDEAKKSELSQNIIKKSIYEYYVTQKFKYKDEHKMTNIFALRNKQKTVELSVNQINSAISVIENLWVEK